MNTQCTTTELEFQPCGPRNVTARFDGGRISSDAGALLLREVDTRRGLVDRAQCKGAARAAHFRPGDEFHHLVRMRRV